MTDNDGNCHYCGKETSSISGNPSEWPLVFCHSDEPGVPKYHHVGCVNQRLNDFEKLKIVHKLQAELCNADVAFWGSNYKDNEWIGVVFCIICSDVFAWGIADCEEASDDDIQLVYNIYKRFGEVGIDAWCSVKRDNLEPQGPYLEKHWDFYKIRTEVEKMTRGRNEI